MKHFSPLLEFPRLFSVTVSEAAVRTCSVKKGVRKISENLQKTHVPESLFQKSCKFPESLKYKKIRAKLKFVSKYSATKGAHLYYKRANFKSSISSSRLSLA